MVAQKTRAHYVYYVCVYYMRATDVVECGNKQTHPKTTVSPCNRLNQSQRRAQQTIPRYPKSTLYNINTSRFCSFIRLKHIYVTLVFLSFHTARTTPLFRDALSFSFNARILIFYSSNSSSSSPGASNPPSSETEASSPLSKA